MQKHRLRLSCLSRSVYLGLEQLRPVAPLQQSWLVNDWPPLLAQCGRLLPQVTVALHRVLLAPTSTLASEVVTLSILKLSWWKKVVRIRSLAMQLQCHSQPLSGLPPCELSVMLAELGKPRGLLYPLSTSVPASTSAPLKRELQVYLALATPPVI